ncbi:hypothetical protein NGR_b10370 (plasmid) [Sinorhizobium fredii NGR234]|uniref:Uncharacterized protein n=1 Tax=Sinorhizobium fredii (strain NBRC 101917 / NGR234) TaxID=394 RepID=C3KQY2_SINFN|nr:hypothetical protein NGR_b10370 [Sinorhizobium fredii NGR234]
MLFEGLYGELQNAAAPDGKTLIWRCPADVFRLGEPRRLGRIQRIIIDRGGHILRVANGNFGLVAKLLEAWSPAGRQSGPGSQPVPSSRRSARAMSGSLRWSIDCVASSPFTSRTASRIRASELIEGCVACGA